MNYSQITDDLFIGTTPPGASYDELRKLGVRLVINMRLWHGRPPGDGNPPIRYLRLHTFDSPLLPIPMEALMRGARTALEVIQRGGKVYTHCSRGRHRGVAMAAAILIAQGWSPEDAMKLIKARRAEADPEAFYIRRRIRLFAEKWRVGSAVKGG
jgi:dual specificity MAP kinase phosphatase